MARTVESNGPVRCKLTSARSQLKVPGARIEWKSDSLLAFGDHDRCDFGNLLTAIDLPP